MSRPPLSRDLLKNWPFGDLAPRRYGVLLVDPPWRQIFYGDDARVRKAPQHHYPCMSLTDIQALPVAELAADDCFLVMWTLFNFAAPGHASDTIKAWGFAPKSGGAWLKTTKHGKEAFGTGYGFRGAAELFFTGVIGAPKRRSASERNCFTTEVDLGYEFDFNGLQAGLMEHSRKPRQMHAALERMFPGVPRAELFAREPRPGWDVWGNEIKKFGRAAI